MFDEEWHIKNLLRWLVQEVLSASGDGDAFWFSEHYFIDNLFPLIQEVNNELNLKWKIDIYNRDGGNYISWHEGQQCIIISNNEEQWNQRPDWTQCAIKC